MLKRLVSLALCIFLVLFYFNGKTSIIPTFQMTESPNVITKGQYGQTLIVELSYSHKGLAEWIETLSEPSILFLVNSEWIQRSPELVQLLKDKKLNVGLLGHSNVDYQEPTLLKEQLTMFHKAFGQLPLWFATADYIVEPAMQEQLFAKKINIVAPTNSLSSLDMAIADGDFISVPLHREQSLSFEVIDQFINKHTLISIEENIFGYKISTKRYPQ
ncbi:MAG: hypothetical protein RR587_14215 [Solibacillus sp.]